MADSVIHWPTPRGKLGPVCGAAFDESTRFSPDLSTMNCEKCKSLLDELGEAYFTEPMGNRYRRYWGILGVQT